MFTGIVQTTAAILASDPTPAGRRLTVERNTLRGEVTQGDSVCVSGVCLTAVDIHDDRLGFDVIPETLLKTSLGQRAVGDRVNLEPAVTPSQPLGGHFMQGHVDGLAEVTAIHTDDGGYRIAFTPQAPYAELMDFIIPRGSVAIDGVSLTLARVDAAGFEVALIPETLSQTTLGTLVVGDAVNIEADILAKTVVHQMQRMQHGTGKPTGEGVTMAMLAQAGFLPETSPGA
ncbi:MAG: riboflavin synthase [Phycisphaerales bacterium JB063]